MREMKLDGRRALVTGSVQGIGLAIAQALASEGCAIVLHGLATAATKRQKSSQIGIIPAWNGHSQLLKTK